MSTQPVARARGSVVAVLSGPDVAASEPFRALLASCSGLTGGSVLVLADEEPADPRSSGVAWSSVPAPERAAAAGRAARERALVFALASGASDPVVREADRTVFVDRDPAVPGSGQERVHVLRTTDPPRDVARLARTLAGRRVALVLGAGGIRGFAHPGVLEVLDEERVPIDLVAGASVGAIAAALYLAGMPPAEMADMRKVIADTVRLAMPGLGISPGALWSGRRLRGYLRAKLGELLIEDLPVPLVIVAAEAGTRREIVLDRGLLADAVWASSALPGLYPPATIGRHRLIDGGLVNPVPITVALERGAGVVVAVNVMSRHSGPPAWRLPNVPVVGRGLNAVPSVARSLRSALSAVRDELASLDLSGADVVIEPKTDRARPWDLLPVRALRRAGREATVQALPQIRALLEPGGQPSMVTPASTAST